MMLKILVVVFSFTTLLFFITTIVSISVKNSAPTQPSSTPSATLSPSPSPVSTPSSKEIPRVDLKSKMIASPFKFTGTVPAGWMNEGSFPVILKTVDGIVISQTIAHENIEGSWQSGRDASFSATLKFSTNETEGLLVLKKDNPSGLSQNDNSYEIQVRLVTSTPSSKEDICTNSGGKWLSSYNECEGLNKSVCEQNSGKFNECASYCRHETDPNKPCILLCVAVCSF